METTTKKPATRKKAAGTKSTEKKGITSKTGTKAGAKAKAPVGLKLAPVHTINFSKDSVEAQILKLLPIDKQVLLLKHPGFEMTVENDNIIFHLAEDFARYLYNDDFISSEDTDKVDALSFIVGEGEDDYHYDSVNRYAGAFFLPGHNPNNLACQAMLMCYIAFQYYKVKFNNIKSLDEITCPIPLPIFINIFKKSKPKVEICHREKDGSIISGMLEQMSIYNGFFESYLQVTMNMVSKGKEKYVVGPYTFKLPLKPIVSNFEDIGIEVLTKELKAELTERGRKYIRYTEKPTYCQYEGFGYKYGGWFGDRRISIKGRIMIDHAAFRMMNSSISDYWYTGCLFNGFKEELERVPEDKLWMCSPYVYAFSFGSKDWVKMSLEDVSDIVFADNAFDELIVPENYKDIFTSCLKGEMPSLDSIEGKGNGKIFLLSGPPGTGKTLSAESVAEYLKMPVYFVTVGELGITPEEMEVKLSEVMDIASSWNAIILLDEVDVFAMKREGTDIQRNAMTAIFLRLLERYSGVMFMTTNLIQNLDPAFVSRATATIEYNALGVKECTQIWKNLLRKAGALGLQIEDEVLASVANYAKLKLNGRGIKNCIRLAYSMAMSKSQKTLTKEMLDSVISLSEGA